MSVDLKGQWHIFGHRTGRPDLVDICEGQDDVLLGVPRELADRIVAAHNVSVRAIQAGTQEEALAKLADRS
jgi:uncharacterized Fe-S cluster-containing radical SAM superfamily protein